MGVPLENLRTLDIIRVNKEELIEKLQSNLEAHKMAYADAIVGYHDEVFNIAQAIGVMGDTENLDPKEVVKACRKVTQLPEPISHEADYVKAIAKLQASVDDEVILSDSEFQQLWMDDWRWKAQFDHAVSSYSSAR